MNLRAEREYWNVYCWFYAYLRQTWKSSFTHTQKKERKKRTRKSSHELYWNSESKILSVFLLSWGKTKRWVWSAMLFVRGRILVDLAYYCTYCYAKTGLKASQLWDEKQGGKRKISCASVGYIYITYLNLSYLDLLFAKYGYNLHLDRLPNLLNYLLSILLSYGFACAFLQCNHFLEL